MLWQGPGARSGLSGAVALTVLMTPVVIRASEEMLRLVPNELREAAYALGVPKWKTIVKVVLPTAIAGILTGITLAIARVIGETAPLLVTAGIAAETNLNPFSGRMTTLPVYAYYQLRPAGRATPERPRSGVGGGAHADDHRGDPLHRGPCAGPVPPTERTAMSSERRWGGPPRRARRTYAEDP